MARRTKKGRNYRRMNKRRVARRYARKGTIMYATPKMVYKATLQSETTTLTILAGNDGTYEFSPSLGDIVSNDLTAFESLYDEFKITGFTWTIVPRGNVANASYTSDVLGAGVFDNLGLQYYSVLDHTDLEPIASADEALEYRNCIRHKSWVTNSRYVPAFVPRLVRDVNNNPMMVTQRSNWMQIKTQSIVGTSYNNKNVAHIGCKLYFEQNPNSTDMEFDFYIKLHCQFRNKK